MEIKSKTNNEMSLYDIWLMYRKALMPEKHNNTIAIDTSFGHGHSNHRDLIKTIQQKLD